MRISRPTTPVKHCVRYVLVPAALIGVIGCGASPETMNDLQAAIGRVSQVNGSGAMSETTSDASKPSSFVILYPDRVNPFEYPADDVDSAVSSASISSVGEIVVLGFANVGPNPRVFLRSSGNTRVLGVGDKLGNIEVQAIDPPRVELKMGTLIWTATMFDHAR